MNAHLVGCRPSGFLPAGWGGLSGSGRSLRALVEVLAHTSAHGCNSSPFNFKRCEVRLFQPVFFLLLMQAALRAAGGELARGLSTALVVRAGCSCPACECSPILTCPSLTCRGALPASLEGPCEGVQAIVVFFVGLVGLLCGVILGGVVARSWTVVGVPVATAPRPATRGGGRGIWLGLQDKDGEPSSRRLVGDGDGSASEVRGGR